MPFSLTLTAPDERAIATLLPAATVRIKGK
jgi:hypothetical protein